MKKAITLLTLLLSLAVAGRAQQGAEALIADCVAYLRAFFQNRPDAQVAVVRFDNESELSDLAMQKIYQMLVSRLEGEGAVNVLDVLVNISGGRGEFALERAAGLDFLIDLKLIQNKSRTGLGLTVFSRLQDRIVSLKYFETSLSQDEAEFLNTRDFAFSGLGFSKLLEFESPMHLMDIRSVAADDGMKYFFYYPDEIIIYQARQTRLEKHFQFKLRWQRPFTPVRHYEGKLLLFRSGPDLILTAGNNFSSKTMVMAFREGRWLEIQDIDFVPFQYGTLNQNPYLVGARYAAGQNFFRDTVYFMPFHDPTDRTVAYEKKVCPAMDMAFAVQEGRLQALHLIDRDYHYRLYGGEFEPQSPLADRKGASLAVLGDEWLALSDHSAAVDRLFFYDIRDGGLRPVYDAPVDGEVQFLSAGIWQGARGFWAGVRQPAGGAERLRVQFWGKRDE